MKKLASLTALLASLVGYAAPFAMADEAQKLLVFWASGNIGKVIVDEALERGHLVVGVSRTPDRLAIASEAFVPAEGDIRDAASVRALIAETSPGIVIVDASPGSPMHGMFFGHWIALQTYRDSSLRWTVATPANEIAPGERTGKYRVATEMPVVDDDGRSSISTEDFAVAMMDEIDKPRFIGRRYTVSY